MKEQPSTPEDWGERRPAIQRLEIPDTEVAKMTLNLNEQQWNNFDRIIHSLIHKIRQEDAEQ